MTMAKIRLALSLVHVQKWDRPTGFSTQQRSRAGSEPCSRIFDILTLNRRLVGFNVGAIDANIG